VKLAGWAVFAAALFAAACAAVPGQKPATPSPTSTSANAPASASPSSGPSWNDPARFASQVEKYAKEAGVDPQLVMAILYNESYKPHNPAAERAWQKLKPDAAFGVANMHQATFDETKRGRPFADRSWQELPDDPDLAIEAASWYLHDLGAQLPPARSGHTTDELLALGYNTGPANMKLFATGTTLGPAAQSYLDSLHRNWDRSAEALENG
jgi:soluble lytic murein transglycosylase-like protein